MTWYLYFFGLFFRKCVEHCGTWGKLSLLNKRGPAARTTGPPTTTTPTKETVMTSPNTTSGLRQSALALRELASLVELHPELPEPDFDLRTYQGGPRITFSYYGSDAEEQIAHLVKVLGVPFTKNDPSKGGYNEKYYVLEGAWQGVSVEIVTHRSTVCERVVVLTEDIEEEIPDPELVKALPTVKQTHTREIVEWQCNPVIAAATAEVQP